MANMSDSMGILKMWYFMPNNRLTSSMCCMWLVGSWIQVRDELLQLPQFTWNQDINITYNLHEPRASILIHLKQPGTCFNVKIDGLMQERRNCTQGLHTHSFELKRPGICFNVKINWLMQEKCNSIANALELRLSCINPSRCSNSVLYCHFVYNAIQSRTAYKKYACCLTIVRNHVVEIRLS